MRRLFVIWLLILALPAQAWAVATGTHCASSAAHRPLGTVERVADGHAHAGFDAHGDPRDHAHAHHGGRGDHLEPAASAASASGDDASSASMTGLGGACSVCATCCVMSVSPAGLPAAFGLAAVRQAPAGLVVRFDSESISALERPPRASIF